VDRRLSPPSGEKKWVQGSARPQQQPNGDIIWDGVLIDVTARKRAEAAIEAASRENTQLASAIANLNSGVVITDPNLPDCPIIFANAASTPTQAIPWRKHGPKLPLPSGARI
jgi:PAS domain-containing protein